MSTPDYGKTVSAAEAFLSDIPMQEEQQKRPIDSFANPLWMYQNTDRINGYLIDPSAKGLPIDREDLLESALYLDRRPRSLIFWMSPEDEESIAKYDELLDKQAKNEVIIVDELKQYDLGKSKFMVWIRYDEVCYKLHPRFEYLRENQS